MMSTVHPPSSSFADTCGFFWPLFIHTLVCPAFGLSSLWCALCLSAFSLASRYLPQDVCHPNLWIFVYTYLQNFYPSAQHSQPLHGHHPVQFSCSGLKLGATFNTVQRGYQVLQTGGLKDLVYIPSQPPRSCDYMQSLNLSAQL